MSGLDDPLITAPMGTLGAAELHGVMPVHDAMHMPYVSLNSTSPGVSGSGRAGGDGQVVTSVYDMG
jgi:hypothetical protein